MIMETKIISCDHCGETSDCTYVDPETMLCQMCERIERWYNDLLYNGEL